MADLIERNDVLTEIISFRKENAERSGDNDIMRGKDIACEFAVDVIANAPAINRWIPVSERMPDDELPVIVAHIDREGYGLPSIGMFRGNPKKWMTSSAIEIVNVTHWMQMPELPVSGVSEDV